MRERNVSRAQVKGSISRKKLSNYIDAEFEVRSNGAKMKLLAHLNNSLDLLIVDDNSPDGTGTEIDTLRQEDPTVLVIHREKKNGTGTAFIQGYKFVQEQGYEYLITMDADLTHDPCYIPAMLDKIQNADIVIGSRYAQGGAMKGWNSFRLPFTYFWRNMIKYGLGMPYDCTGAYRLYRVSAVKPTIYSHVRAKGFAFCMESLYHFSRKNARIQEVPIIAHSRIHGDSKLSFGIIS